MSSLEKNLTQSSRVWQEQHPLRHHAPPWNDRSRPPFRPRGTRASVQRRAAHARPRATPSARVVVASVSHLGRRCTRVSVGVAAHHLPPTLNARPALTSLLARASSPRAQSEAPPPPPPPRRGARSPCPVRRVPDSNVPTPAPGVSVPPRSTPSWYAPRLVGHTTNHAP